jgi:hypothetical protein
VSGSGSLRSASTRLRENLPLGLAELDGYDPIWLLAKHATSQHVPHSAELFHNADANITPQPQAGDAYLRGILGGTTHVLNNLSTWSRPITRPTGRHRRISFSCPGS